MINKLFDWMQKNIMFIFCVIIIGAIVLGIILGNVFPNNKNTHKSEPIVEQTESTQIPYETITLYNSLIAGKEPIMHYSKPVYELVACVEISEEDWLKQKTEYNTINFENEHYPLGILDTDKYDFFAVTYTQGELIGKHKYFSVEYITHHELEYSIEFTDDGFNVYESWKDKDKTTLIYSYSGEYSIFTYYNNSGTKSFIDIYIK